MKQLRFTLLLGLLMSMMGVETFAHDIAVENADGKTIYYWWTNNKTELEVSYQGGSYSSYSEEYSGDIVIPKSVTYNGKNYPVTSIGSAAFKTCSSLTSVTIPSTITSIGSSAFSECSGLTSVHITDIAKWCKISFNDYSSNPLYYAHHLFLNGEEIKDLVIPNSVTSIRSNAFRNCSSLTSVTIPSTVTSIGDNAFSGCDGVLIFSGATPPTLIGSSACGNSAIIRVPDSSLETYRTAATWTDLATRIIALSTKIDYDVTVNVDNSRSALHEVIGEDNLNNVVSLKVTGSINSYDIMVIRNKMGNLRYLDLTDANIVANNYEYYTGCHTEDNVIGNRSFDGLKLVSVKLPKNVTRIGDYAFHKCSHLQEVALPATLKTIGSYAFYSCSINEMIIPYGVTSIGSNAFETNSKLKRIALPSTLKTIGMYIFRLCEKLESISLPTSLESIPTSAFYGCGSLTRIDIPSTITSIGSQAFDGCAKLTDVYTYIVEPTPIQMSTFSGYKTATLHVPATSYYNYWYDTEWGQFSNVEEFIATYEYFYINKDFTIGEEQGTISGSIDGDDPDADLNPGSGLIIETKPGNPQELDELHIKAKGSDCASVITASNLQANKVYFDIEVSAGRWYFLSFPFNVKRADIQAPGSYVFRIYDPSERANGKVGWQNWIGDLLQKGQGYIFQCSKAGTLSLCVEKAATNWASENRQETLVSNPATNQQDASWNFIGNPQTSYYDIDQTGYKQPITVWNGTAYEAVRPGDDDYALAPFEAFFVQKPEGQSAISFPADGRYTKIQWTEEQKNKAAARRSEGVSTDRQLINLTLSDGTNEDKTRVVFNEQRTKDYEMECDAPKFLSSEQVPQLYTLDQQQGLYAINERPTGEVQIGYMATTKGELTIAATRMDQPVLLRDNEMQTTHDLSLGGYTFTTEAGTNNSRFTLVTDGSMTGVGQLRQLTGVSVMAEEGGISFLGIGGQTVNVYSTGGKLLAGQVGDGFMALSKAAYIIKVGTATTKVIVR